MSEEKPLEETSPPVASGKAAFNLVTDTVAGPNLRFKDNLYQAIAIFVCLVLGAVIGLLAARDRLMGPILGAFIGLNGDRVSQRIGQASRVFPRASDDIVCRMKAFGDDHGNAGAEQAENSPDIDQVQETYDDIGAERAKPAAWLQYE